MYFSALPSSRSRVVVYRRTEWDPGGGKVLLMTSGVKNADSVCALALSIRAEDTHVTPAVTYSPLRLRHPSPSVAVFAVLTRAGSVENGDRWRREGNVARAESLLPVFGGHLEPERGGSALLSSARKGGCGNHRFERNKILFKVVRVISLANVTVMTYLK